MLRSTFLVCLLVGFLLPGFGVAQSGSWSPPGADINFPRTLTTTELLPAVRASLAQPDRLPIYNQVFNLAFSAVPGANATSAERGRRARLAKNAAFVFLIDRQKDAGVAAPLTPEQHTALSTKVKTLLQTANTAVEANTSYTEWQWRSKELIDYLIAYDLLRGGGIPADSLVVERAALQQFAGGLYAGATQTVPFFGSFFGNIKNNHALMTAAALGMAAVVLNDATSATASLQPQSWIQAAMFTIDNVLWRDAARQSVPGKIAGYAEGPYYFKYAFLNLLPFFRSMGNFLPAGSQNYTFNGTTRSIQNPFFDPNYDLLYQWAAAIALPDGRLPALEDSYHDQAMPELALTGKPQFVKPLWLQNLPTVTNTLSKQLDGTVDMRAAWLAANITPTNPSDSLVSLPLAGNLVFRSGTGAQANYLHLYGKNGAMLSNSGGHNQADAASFQLYGKGQMLALDPGYLSYASRTELGNATNHNMILVDGAGPAMGTSGIANDAQAFVKGYFQQNGLGFGEVTTSYQNAGITRMAISVRGEYFILTDFVSSAQPRQFTWQLHGYGLENGTVGTGTFTPVYSSKTGVWQKNGSSLAATVATTNAAAVYKTTTGVHEAGYEVRQNHSVMQVQQTAQEAAFVAVLRPYTQQAPNTVAVLNLPAASGAIIESTHGAELVLAKTDTALYTLATPEISFPVTSNATLTFLATDLAGGTRQFLLHEGTNLATGGVVRLSATKRGTFAWQELTSGTAQGYASLPATIQVRAAGFPLSVTGRAVQSWADRGNNLVEITLAGAGSFEVNYSQATLPVELIKFTAKAMGQNALLEWETTAEKANAGYEIRVSENGAQFRFLATVQPALHQTGTNLSYQFTDTTPGKSGTRFYRLLQHDSDGKVNLLGTRAVSFAEAENLTIEVFPNPFMGAFTVKAENLPEGEAIIEITDLPGRLIHRTIRPVRGGNLLLQIGQEVAFPKGVLLLNIRTENGLKSQRIISR